MLPQPSQRRTARWKWGLLALCGLMLVMTAAQIFDLFGFGARPWFGWWDSNVSRVQPYVLAIMQPRPGGASARAGLRDGDLIDLREQTPQSRQAIAYQLNAEYPTRLVVHRGTSVREVTVLGSTSLEGAPLWKLPPVVARFLSALFLTLCATVIALRRSEERVPRTLALVFLFTGGTMFDPTLFVVPNVPVAVALFVFSRLCAVAASVLLVKLSAGFGARAAWRTALERGAYGVIAVGFAMDVASAIGLTTLRIDPLPFTFRIGVLRSAVAVAGYLAVVLAAGVAVSRTAVGERARAAWLLLPLPIALLTSTIVSTLATVIYSWFANVAVSGLDNTMRLVGALIVTYALLKRRVLDVEFVLGRTVVVATVSLIVVAAFILLEWMLGTVLTDASHAEGLVANAALALGLGLSLRFIHKRVDAAVDSILFRKRHEDERALLEFSKEAAYVTDPEALLDLTIENVRRHTDARSASLLLARENAYDAVRSFGEHVSSIVGENDAAILSLKTWHRPIDPHHCASALNGALALPMLARGRLIGVLLLGERAGGEAYAPDEVESLSQLAYGVGSALDALAAAPAGSLASIQAAVASMADSIAGLREALVGDVRPSA